MRRMMICLTLLVSISLSATAFGYFSDSVYIPDIETFMQIGGNFSPQVSRDGSVRCFTSSMSGVTQMYRVEDNWPVQLTFFPDGVDYYRLSHDGKWAIAGAAIGGSEQTNLHLVEVATGRTESLTDYEEVQISGPIWSADDSRIYYRSNEANKKDFHAFEMTMGSGIAKPVFVQEGYNGPAMLSHDGNYLITYRYNSNVDNNLFMVSLAEGTSEVLTEHEGTSLYDPAGFSADGKTLAYWDQGYIGPIYTTSINLTVLQLDKGALPIYQR